MALPSLAAAVVRSVAHGEPLLAQATALLAQAGVAVWLCGRATRAFYEGELESGGRVRRSKMRRATGILSGELGALFHRERAYLLRDILRRSRSGRLEGWAAIPICVLGGFGRFRRGFCLHERGVIENGLVGIGHRERGDRIVEHLALARVAGNGGRVARSRVGAREGPTA